MESEHTASSATPITEHQEKMDVLIGQLPEAAQKGGDNLNALLGQITKLKHNVAAVTLEKLKYYKDVVENILNDLKDAKADQSLSLNIEAAMRGLVPVAREKTFKIQKRDPLQPDGTSQGR